MVRVWHDWEFLDTGRRIYPISVALYRESDGAEYYAVFAEAHPMYMTQNSWILQNVWPKLRLDGGGQISWDEEYVKSRREIAIDILDFLNEAEDVELWADYGAYDHVTLAQLWGPMTAIPPVVPMWTNDLRTEIARRKLASDELPQQDPATQHNALADVRHEALVMRFLNEFDRCRNEPDQQQLISAAVEGRWPG